MNVLTPSGLAALKFALTLASVAGFLIIGEVHADDVVINPNYPIRGPNGVNLSPPDVHVTNECATHVYVDSFVPGATIRVFLNGATLIGGPIVSKFGFAAFTLTHTLNVGDKVTATQTVNGVTSAPTAPPMVVDSLPPTLPPPQMGSDMYACGRVAPVHGLVSGVTVEVRDETASSVIGKGSTPNDWGDDWDPVVVPSLQNGHKITATQAACTGVKSLPSAQQPVNSDPSPLTAPNLDPPVVGNNAVTAHGLFTGSIIHILQGMQIGDGASTSETNWSSVSPDVAAHPPSPQVTADQDLCTTSPSSPPQTPVTQLPPPKLVSPICVDQLAATVRDSTINAILVLVKNGAVVGYGGAAPDDAPLDIAPPAAFVLNDKVQVAEYIGSDVAMSNTVTVGCHDVITYHNDAQRTGWNPSENTLTPANVTPKTFGLIAPPTPLDDQVDVQPLIVTNQPIEGQGVHTVVYLATENNTVYAIDSFSGTILNKVNLGTPVPRPLNCENNGPVVGINGTPTVDLDARTLYVIAYVMVGTTPTHQLHALDLATLADRPGSPRKVTATNTLEDGSSHTFDSSVQRQRPALLEANGNIYAGFGSYCDFQASKSRGWVLGWNKGTLAPLSSSKLLSKATTGPNFDCYFHAPWTQNHPCFLSSVWMSGYGIAADSQGDLFFTTGNTAPGIYDSTFNIAESMVKLSGDLTNVLDFFTPADESSLDAGDTDYGSGGTLVLPDQPGNTPHLAVAAGKDGNLFIVNRDTGQMGGFHSPNIPGSVSIGDECWCGPSYFTGSDGVGRVVTSGGLPDVNQFLDQWTVNTSLHPPLSKEASALLPGSGQDGGFFTSVSSNGTDPNTAIIWAVNRPVGDDNHLTLFAFNATASGSSLNQLWSGEGGTWPNANSSTFGGANANVVPTAANGMVYVASYKQLRIFGLTSPSRFPPRRAVVAAHPVAEFASLAPNTGPLYWGTIRRVEGSRITLELRNDRMLEVDASHVVPQATSDFGAIGRGLAVSGTMAPDGVFVATGIWRTKGKSLWGEDREQ